MIKTRVATGTGMAIAILFFCIVNTTPEPKGNENRFHEARIEPINPLNWELYIQAQMACEQSENKNEAACNLAKRMHTIMVKSENLLGEEIYATKVTTKQAGICANRKNTVIQPGTYTIKIEKIQLMQNGDIHYQCNLHNNNDKLIEAPAYHIWAIRDQAEKQLVRKHMSDKGIPNDRYVYWDYNPLTEDWWGRVTKYRVK